MYVLRNQYGRTVFENEKQMVCGSLCSFGWGVVLTGCDTGTSDGGNGSGAGGNVTMILVNNHATTITKWEFYNKTNLTPSSQNVTIPSGEAKTISLTMNSPFVMKNPGASSWVSKISP
jgi:hypothetical protein